MLNVNDDMDDFLRKAAEDYPLKISGSDWDKIAGAIIIPEVPVAGKRNRRFLWFLMPLLIAGGVWMYYRSVNKVITQQAETTINTQKQPEKINDSKIAATATAGKKSIPAANQEIVSGNGEKNRQSDKSGSPKSHSQKSNSATSQKLSTTSVNAGENWQSNKKKTPASVIGGAGTQRKATGSNKDERAINNNHVSQSAVKTSANDIPGALNKDKVGTGNIQPADKGLNTAVTGIINKDSTTVKITDNASGKAVTGIINKDTISSNNIAANDSGNTVHKTSSKKTVPAKKRGFYAGAEVSGDATTVKFHSIKNIGYDFSFIAGYRFNNHWSLESGIMWDAKKYYSTGKYFDKSKTDLSADYNIHFLNGTCNMYELPLNVKYDFESKKKSGFYAVTGLSSYIMKKEKYSYFTTHYSSPDDPGYYGERAYRNSTNNWFAVANISGGYQFIYKNNSSIRIEPFLKIPLGGLGIGKLPFMSTGISAAYTLPLH